MHFCRIFKPEVKKRTTKDENFKVLSLLKSQFIVFNIVTRDYYDWDELEVADKMLVSMKQGILNDCSYNQGSILK